MNIIRIILFQHRLSFKETLRFDFYFLKPDEDKFRILKKQKKICIKT